MKALKEANENTGLDIITATAYSALAIKNATTLYVVGDIVTDGNGASTIVPDAVYVGSIGQDVLLNNDGDVVWIAPDAIAAGTFTNAGIPLVQLV